MESRKVFTLDQDLGPDDLNGLQDCVSNTFDHLTGAAVTKGKRYSGLDVTASTQTKIGVAPGTLFSNSEMYDFPNALIEDTLLRLPQAGKLIVTVVAFGKDNVPDAQTPREFLIDETTGLSQARPVTTQTRRVCIVQFAYGIAAPSPTAPLIDPGYTPIADVTLNTTGIESIAMRGDTRLSSLDDLDSRVDDLEEFEAVVGPKVTTLSSDLAALAKQLTASASNMILGQALMRIAVLEAKAGIPQTAASSHADYYLDARGLDLANPLSNCKQKEGIRFPDANKNFSQLGIQNPMDIGAKIVNGILFPAYTRKLWLSTGTASDQVRISSYSYQTNSLVQKTMARQVTRYGAAYDVCTNSAFWQSGTYDPIAGIFTRNGETYKAQLDLNGLPAVYTADGFFHAPMRIQQYWVDTVQETYWDTVSVPHDVNGAFVAETFLQGQDIWLDAVGLFFTKLAATGDATVAICEVNKANGLPDLTSVISITNLPRAAMSIAPVETVVGITPCFLEAGKRYAVCVITAADHWLATVPGEQFTSGTFFYVLDGAYAQGDGTRDIQLKLYRAVPNQSRTRIELNPLSLDGGILGIEVNADTVVPSQCVVSYEVQVNGTWYALSDVDTYTLGQGGAVLPLLRFAVTFLGSADMMGAVTLTGSQVTLSRPGTALTSISAPLTLPAPSTQVHVVHRYENWQAAYHTAGIKLLTGGTPAGGSTSYGTSVNPSSYSDTPGVDPIGGPYIERHYVFNLGAGVSSYCVRTDMATQSNRAQFHVAYQKDYAF